MKIDVMTKDKNIKTVVPALRFPEFRDGEGWKRTPILEICEIIGGGTPSVIEAKYIEEIMKVLKEAYTLSDDVEITIEVNPGTVTKEKLQTYKINGINRLSIGMQSTNNNILKQLGRIHNFQQFLNSYNLARELKFDNINIDLMINLQNQNIDEELDTILSLNPEHLSVYSLIIEKDTPIYNMVKNKKYKLPKEEVEREAYWKIKIKLEENRIHTL